MDHSDLRCDRCDSRAVIRGRDGLWCAKCALARIGDHSRDDTPGSNTEEGTRVATRRAGTGTDDRPDRGETGKL